MYRGEPVCQENSQICFVYRITAARAHHRTIRKHFCGLEATLALGHISSIPSSLQSIDNTSHWRSIIERTFSEGQASLICDREGLKRRSGACAHYQLPDLTLYPGTV